jgi:hypothetical protein
MLPNFIIIIIALFIFGILIYTLVSDCHKPVEEGWTNYMELPFGNVRSGSGDNDVRPVSFYEYPIYRRPLNYPVCHLVDYPVPHCRTDSL